MRRSARVQALETIKRRKLTKQTQQGDHVINTKAASNDTKTAHGKPPADNATPLVGPTNASLDSDHVTNHVIESNGNHVIAKSAPSTNLNHVPFRTTRSQTRMLSQGLISQTNSNHVTNHMTSSSHVTLNQFRYAHVKAEPVDPEVEVKTEPEADSESHDVSRDVKTVKIEPRDLSEVKLEKSAYFKPEIEPEIEECATFAKPEEFDVALNPEVLTKPGPRDWGVIYGRVKKMRSLVNAPVDTMGCERLVQDGVPARVQRFQLLISLMLSSQTKDEVTCQAVLNLREFLKSRDLLLSIEGIQSMKVSEIDECICKVGFHNRKADYISRATALLVSDFDSDIPPTIAGMTSLPGVGPKMAHLLMHRGWGVNEGIGVDVHVHRLAGMWGWVKSKTPEETRVQLEKWLPQELWVDINPTLVGFGQTICPSKGKKCGVCVLTRKECKARVGGMSWKEEKWMKEGYEGMVIEYEKS